MERQEHEEEAEDRDAAVSAVPPPSSANRAAATGVAAVALVLAGLALGGVLFGGAPAQDAEATAPAHETHEWTCSMHPQVRLPARGQCPICQMDLIPADGKVSDEAPAELTLSAAAKALAEVRTVPVRRAAAARDVALVGRVTYDETRVQRVASFVPGRIERLYVDVTGTRVRAGEHLLRIYSPALLAAQHEWIGALQQAARTPAGTAAHNVLSKTAAAAEERLRLWGLSEGQRKRIKEGGQPRETLTVYAPRGGVVVERQAVVGMYVDEGTPLYTVAELDHLWVELEAYESDLVHVRFGQTATLSTDALPGRQWQGRVAFVSPIVDERSRTVRVRVNFNNEDGALKPGMLVRATLHARVDAHGHVVTDEALEEAWVCPMHPDVVEHAPGRCDVCGMKLEPATSLGLVSASASGDAQPLLIPASAPLLTGRRAVVYVELPDRERPTYEGRAVVLGPRVGADYVVLEGLDEGERVVAEGAFKIDAAMQVRARPSLMNGALPTTDAEAASLPRGVEGASAAPAFRPSSSAPRPAAAPATKRSKQTKRASSAKVGATQTTGRAAVDLYLQLERALSGDDLTAARAAAAELASATNKAFEAGAPPGWGPQEASLRRAGAALGAAGDLKAMRQAFVDYSTSLLSALDAGGAPAGPTLHRFFCPMAARGKGAEWLQTTPDLTNPYFGSRMLKCGEARGTIADGEGAR